MTTIEALLNKRWIVKAEEKDLYYQVKDEAGQYKKFFSEKLGYQIVINPYLIKLEKMSAKAEPWMGILEFTDKLHYVFLCLLLMLLEDLEAGEQFVLSQLTEYIQAKYEEEKIDWTLFQYRRHLIKVIKFCVNNYIIKVNDGSEDSFISDYEGDVLYENTGISKYFMKIFSQNILNFTKPEEFAASEWIDVNEDRGIIRRQRVYRKLLLTMGVDKEGEEDEDFAYIKNYRNMIEEDFQSLFECELQVYKTSAYLIMGDNCSVGRAFPTESTLSDIILLCNYVLKEKIERREIFLQADESAKLSLTQFQSIIEECRRRYASGLIKTFREKTGTEFYQLVEEYMEINGFILIDHRHAEVQLRPIIGKIVGNYPKDFLTEEAVNE